MRLPVVAIVGRPNVGKSTLFNRIAGGRRALVADRPGMTRDRHYATATYEGRRFMLVDTGGFEPDVREGLTAAIAAQTRLAMEEADVAVVLFDVRQGLTGADRDVVEALRPLGRRLVFAANKAEGRAQELAAAEFFDLGLDHVLPVSAEHGLGMEALLDAVLAALPEEGPDPGAGAEAAGTIRLALVGRPNAGKSALLNRLTGSQRAIVSDTPGTTRDPVDAVIEDAAGRFRLVDTAGIRRRRRSGPAEERLAVLRARRALEDAQVACLVVDAAEGVASGDARIAALAAELGRGLLVLLNKMDLVPPGAARRKLKAQMDDRLYFADWAPALRVSAETGKGCRRILPEVARVFAARGRRIPTAELNRFLEETLAAHPPPSHRGRPVRLYYITQAQAHPPTFIVSTNAAQGIKEAYRRYLLNRIRERYDFAGTPLRVFFRQRGRGAERG